MLITIAINYLGGLAVGTLRDRHPHTKAAAGALFVTIAADLAILGYFKYAATTAHLIGSLLNRDITILSNVALPVGISFYTFQSISYVVDVYRQKTDPQKNIIDLALYIALFPQLVAGPIVKYTEINQQLSVRETSVPQTAYGIKRFVFGLAKKVLIANQLAKTVDTIYALSFEDLSTSLAWAGALLYTLQIYYDFSGYSDMAIGLGQMFGFSFPENFDLPYASRSIREFWRRWHISLSTWFREYVYIPLGGNRKGTTRTYINLMIVFFVTGVWHGAGLSFIVWGFYHGVLMLIERMGWGKILDRPGMHLFSRFYTLFTVIIGWVFFRADRLVIALEYLRTMFVPTPGRNYAFQELISTKTLLVFFVGILLCGVVQTLLSHRSGQTLHDFFVQKTAPTSDQADTAALAPELAVSLLLLVLFIACLVNLIAGSYNPFIYFRF